MLKKSIKSVVIPANELVAFFARLSFHSFLYTFKGTFYLRETTHNVHLNFFSQGVHQVKRTPVFERRY